MIADDRTGYSHQKCFARASADCSTKISGEHWISANLLERIARNGMIDIKGPNWTRRPGGELRVDDFKSNILCERHNRALSPLDAAAGELFRVLALYQSSLVARDNSAEFALFNGATIEKWLLKLLWGMAAAKVSLDPHGQRVTELGPGVPEADLAEYLFRGKSWPCEWGMHVSYIDRTPIGAGDAFAVNPYLDESSRLVGVGAEFGAVSLRIGLASQTQREPGRIILTHPAGIVLRNTAGGEKAVAFGWSGEVDMPFVVHVGEPPDDTFTKAAINPSM